MKPKDVLRKLPDYHELTITEKPSYLWPRFNKARTALYLMLTGGAEHVSRQLSTFSWSGYDTGSHDHAGTTHGIHNGVSLKAKIVGSTFDRQQYFDESMNLRTKKVARLEILCSFISGGLEGIMSINVGNSNPFEAFWLQYYDGTFRLEQVCNSQGQVYDADKLTVSRLPYTKDEITIPNTDVSLPLFTKVLKDNEGFPLKIQKFLNPDSF